MGSFIFDIADYGARADGKNLNTRAIQSAIDACHAAGGGCVVCGAGVWLTGSLELKSNVELHLSPGCRLVGSPDLKDYPLIKAEGYHHELASEKSSHALIHAIGAERIAITGPGTIDGSGIHFYKFSDGETKFQKPDTPRPRGVMLLRCRNVRIADVHIENCACWTIWLMQCSEVGVRGVEIHSDKRMRTVDGIDIDSCRNVTVSDCRIFTEDDSIVLRAIQKLYDTPAVCENVTVTNCVLSSVCQGIRVGCPSDGTIQNCTFSNLNISSAAYGITFDNPKRYLSQDCNGSADIHHIYFSNCLVRAKRAPLRITVEDGIQLKRLSDISFSNCDFEGASGCVISGTPQTTIRRIRLNNVNIRSTEEPPIKSIHCEEIHLSSVQLSHQPQPETSA